MSTTTPAKPIITPRAPRTDPITAAINRAIALLNSAQSNPALAPRFAEDAAAELTAVKPATPLKPPVTNKPTVALIVGHDATAKGAYSPTLAMSEYDYWKSVAGYVNTALNLPFNPVAILRDKIGISGAYAQADRLKPALIVELHFNASTSKSAKGFEILYADGRIKALTAAKAMTAAWKTIHPTSTLRQAGTGLLPVSPSERGGFNVHASYCPSVLIEPFFGSNAAESKLYANRFNMALALTHMIQSALQSLSSTK